MWWQLQVWSQWDREQMSILWIVSLKPANSKYKTREQALSLEWNNMGHSFPHTQASHTGPVGNCPGGWGSLPIVPDFQPQTCVCPFLSDTSKVQTIGIFRVFTTSAELWGRSMWSQPWIIFRNVSIAAAWWLLGTRLGEAVTPAFTSVLSCMWMVMQQRKGWERPKPMLLPLPITILTFGERQGLMLWILTCWISK